MAITTSARAAWHARALGFSVPALALLLTVAVAKEKPTYRVRDYGITGFALWQPSLLSIPGVQEELRLTDAQKKEHEALMRGRIEQFRKMRGEIKDAAQLKAAREKYLAEIDTAVQEQLTPEQRQRLEQIQFQLMGPTGFARPRRESVVDVGPPLAQRLKLSPDQVAQIEKIVIEGVQQIDEAAGFPLTLDSTNGPPSTEAISTYVDSPEFAAAKQKATQAGREARAALLRRVEDALTDSQRAAYHALLGAPFDLSRLNADLQDARNGNLQDARAIDCRVVAALYGLGGQRADPSFDTSVARPAYAGVAEQPRVLFDEGHNNFHTASGRYKPFAELITSDGCRVIPNRDPLIREVLDKGDILVIANALPSRESDESAQAFTAAECDAIRDWVGEGGSLLLIADHAPFGPAAGPLAQRFGVDVSKGAVTFDNANSEGGPSSLVFSRANHLLGDHPITRGREDSERINKVQTFTGTSLKGPEASVLLYKLADTAVDRTLGEDKGVPASGRCQGLALSFGKGRVVVLGEAGELSAQVVGAEGEKFGMNVPGIDNRQMALNIMHWLSGLIEPRPDALKKAG